MSIITKDIRSDLYRVIPETFSPNNLIRGLRSKGFKFLLFYRLRKSNNKWIIRFFSKLMLRYFTHCYGFQIPEETKIGAGLFIGHFGTIVISANAVMGENCNIAHNVTIGAARGKRSGAPKIGNKVWIGTGAVIVGNISIGDNVLIAPNCFVNIDVPTQSIVIGNPAMIISKENPTKNYINNILNS